MIDSRGWGEEEGAKRLLGADMGRGPPPCLLSCLGGEEKEKEDEGAGVECLSSSSSLLLF